MRKVSTLFAVIATCLYAAAVAGTAHAEIGVVPAVDIPQSLDAFYPPAAQGPVYLQGMLELDAYFSGVLVDLMEDDLAGAKSNLEAFRNAYAATRGQVPEWAGHYPEGPVEELAAAFQSGDRGRLMEAFGEVGKVCHHCHLATMVPVQQRYHWQDFGGLRVEDPMTREVVDYARFKRLLAVSLTGIGVNLRQGQPEGARRQFDAFRARFAELSESCTHCHDEESAYYVDGRAQARVQELGRALAEGRTPTEQLLRLVQGIGRDTCFRCHLVHVPAAVAQAAGR